MSRPPDLRRSETETGHEDLLMDMAGGSSSMAHDGISRVEQQTLLKQIAACSAREKRLALFPEVQAHLDRNSTGPGQRPAIGSERGIGMPMSVGSGGFAGGTRAFELEIDSKSAVVPVPGPLG